MNLRIMKISAETRKIVKKLLLTSYEKIRPKKMSVDVSSPSILNFIRE